MRFSLLLLIGCLLLLSCRKKEYTSVKIIAHAGSGLSVTNAPFHDNSLEAIEYALDMEGVAGVEVDVQCSASSTAWLYHDASLETKSNGSGCINSRTDDYLADLHYTTALKENIIQLSELNFPYDTRELFLDVRSSNECEGKLIDQNKIIAAIQNALPGVAPERLLVVTNKTQFVNAFVQLGWRVYLEVEDVNSYLSSSEMPVTTGICIRNAAISSEEIKSVRKTGKQVVLYDVRSPRGIRSALNKYPDYLMTDDLKATLIQKYR